MRVLSRVEMMVGKTCLSVRYYAGHRQWSKNAVIALVERYFGAVQSILRHVLTLAFFIWSAYIPPVFSFYLVSGYQEKNIPVFSF